MAQKVREKLASGSWLQEQEESIQSKIKVKTRTAEPSSTSSDAHWSAVQQKALEKALKSFPKGTDQRWEKIAKQVPDKRSEDCINRFKFLAEKIKKKKEEENAALEKENDALEKENDALEKENEDKNSQQSGNDNKEKCSDENDRQSEHDSDEGENDDDSEEDENDDGASESEWFITLFGSYLKTGQHSIFVIIYFLQSIDTIEYKFVDSVSKILFKFLCIKAEDEIF